MKTRLIHLLKLMTTNFWMIPVLFLLLATALAFFNFYLDKTVFFHQIDLPDMFLYFNNLQSIRTLLSVSAGSILGVAGVSFSITIASLTLASQQFGSRLINNFMLDRFNQTVLGIFMGTFWYCIIMLEFTSSINLETTIPFISMVSVLVLVVINLLILVIFIHHISVSIKAESIIDEVSTTLKSQLESFFPESSKPISALPSVTVSECIHGQFKKEGKTICSAKSGYLQALDVKGLLKFVTEENISVNITIKPGDFVIKGSVIAQYLAEQKTIEKIDEKVYKYFLIGSNSTAEQDPEYAIRQLVEVAVRALSPGINDPFTAISCINRLGDNIAFLINRQFPIDGHFDESGKLRLQLRLVTFSGIVEASFNQIMQHGKSDIAVIIHLLKTLLELSNMVISTDQAEAIKIQANSVFLSSEDVFYADKDRRDLSNCYDAIVNKLGQKLSA